MQRTLKFRAWDTKAKEWVTDRITVGLKNEKSCPETEKDQAASLCVFSGQNNCIIMQFTGLRDKNGKEIYEGDVVSELRKSRSFPEGRLSKRIIEWSNDMTLDDSFGETAIGFNLFYGELEVIGNIHENPDLLT